MLLLCLPARVCKRSRARTRTRIHPHTRARVRTRTQHLLFTHSLTFTHTHTLFVYSCYHINRTPFSIAITWVKYIKMLCNNLFLITIDNFLDNFFLFNSIELLHHFSFLYFLPICINLWRLVITCSFIIVVYMAYILFYIIFFFFYLFFYYFLFTLVLSTPVYTCIYFGVLFKCFNLFSFVQETNYSKIEPSKPLLNNPGKVM